MPFCSCCGQEIESQTRFCPNCGEKVAANFYNYADGSANNAVCQNKEDKYEYQRVKNTAGFALDRQVVYDGIIHKCPNCGEILNSFSAICPTCGYELRGANATNSVKELAAKLESIESKRDPVKHNLLKSFYFGQSLTKTDEQKISIIRSFSIPNTKEDLYEFLIMSESNIDIEMYDDGGNQFKKNDARRAVSDAWKAKFEQAYQKAKILFAGDPRFAEIQILYDNTHKKIKKAKWKTWKFIGVLYGIFLVLFLIIFSFTFLMSSNDEKKEIARLEDIEDKIEEALEDGDYKYALMNADRLDFNGSDAGLEKDWEIKREYWISKVIEEAANNGVILEYPTDSAEEKDTERADNNVAQNYQQNIEDFSNQVAAIQEQMNSVWNHNETKSNVANTTNVFNEGT